MANIERILRAVEGVPWAIQPEKLETIVGILVAKAETGQIPTAAEVAEAEAAARASDVKSEGGIAVLNLIGTISRRMGMLEAMSGGASVEGYMRAYRAAMDDSSIGSIITVVHSPGGSVYGIEEAARRLQADRGKKRHVMIADNLMASAAYYIGSATDELVVTPSGEVGSIGVYMVHFDWSAYLKEEGVKPTIIKAGPHKAEGNPYEPLGDDAHAHLQSQVDDYYDLFINSVAKGRGVSVATVREEFGGGRTLTAKRAVAAGMADRVATLEEVIADLQAGKPAPARGRKTQIIVPSDLAAADAVARDASEELEHAERAAEAFGAVLASAIAKLAPAAAEAVSPTGDAPSVVIDAGTVPANDPVWRAALADLLVDFDTRRVGRNPDNSTSATTAETVADDGDDNTPAAPSGQGEAMDPKDQAATNGAAVEAAVSAERERCATIRRLATEHNIDATTADGWVAQGLSVDAVRGQILDRVRGQNATAPNVTMGADREAERPFESLGHQLQAIRNAAASPDQTDRRLLRLNSEYVAAMGAASNVPSDGGFVIQPTFASGIVKKAWEDGRVLSRTRRVPIGEGSNALVRNVVKENSRATGKRYGGVRVYRTKEAGTVEASRQQMDQQRINLEKLMGLFYATDEIMQDATALTAEAEQGFRSELLFVAENEVFRGTGAGEMLGVLTSNALVTVAKETSQAAGTIVIQNVAKMLGRLPASSFSTAAWFVNPSCIPQLVTMTLGNQPVFLPGGNAAGARFGTLMGLPIEPVEYCEAVGTVGDICLLDLAQYTTIDKGGASWADSIHVRFIYDETAFKITYRINGQPDWPEAVTPFKGSDKISPFVALATRS